jgi:hypothetical protein
MMSRPHRRQAQVAAHQVRVIARQQDDLTRPDHEFFCSFAVDPDMKVALDHVVIENDVGCRPERGLTLLRGDARRHAPRCEEVGVQKRTTGQMRHPQDVG